MGKLLLAPMEGLADHVLRDVLTRVGGYDGAVTEFVRVSGSLLPLRTYRRISPEIGHGSRTPAGTPVAVQLVAAKLHEARLVRAGTAFQRVTDWHRRRPPLR